MGLLDRARISQTGEQKQDFLAHLVNLDKGVDFPVVLFKKLVAHYSVDKGALFFTDSNGSFSCLSSKGYDKTTTNRLRLDPEAAESRDFKVMTSEGRSLCTSVEPSFLKDFMSSREFGLLETIYWIPFIKEEKLFSLIMISQWNGVEPENWEVLFNGISEKLATALFNSRKSLVQSQGGDSRKRPREQEIRENLEKRESGEYYLMEVNLEMLIQSLLKLREGLSVLNLKNEILRVFKTLAGPGQDVVDLDNNRLLLVLDKHRTPDKGLFLHQLSSSLPLLFQELETPPVLETKEYQTPADSDELDSLIGSLL